jgi:hypothetical protein
MYRPAYLTHILLLFLLLLLFDFLNRCVHYGVLAHEEAERVYNLLTSKKRNPKATASSSPPRKKVKKEQPDGVVSSSADL